jgi:hypothetical protein
MGRRCNVRAPRLGNGWRRRYGEQVHNKFLIWQKKPAGLMADQFSLVLPNRRF